MDDGCRFCGGVVDARGCAGICHICLSPEARGRRLDALDGPVGATLRKAAVDLDVADVTRDD